MCAVGDNMMDRYLASGTMYPGGGAVNVAVHASRAGARAGYVGLIGDDDAGDLVVSALHSEGVETSRCRRVAEPNAVTDVAISETGERTFVSYTTPAAVLELSATDRAHLEACDWVYTNYSSATEHLVPALADLAPLAFDFSYKEMTYAAPLLPHVDIAAFSRSSLDEAGCRELIAETHARGPRYVIVTRGPAGTLVGVPAGVLVHAAEPVDVVDTLGAGDAYLARFVCGVFGGEDPPDAARAAGHAAAQVCRSAGAFGHPYPSPLGKERNDINLGA